MWEQQVLTDKASVLKLEHQSIILAILLLQPNK
ncbi:hypothetical protein A1E_04135 [Rickettsia canadensis str. McKiel]|uniref:Uncharacterized protein n=2 Tax=Rickettsia canadensis TaxID=788 RepID=A8EZH0_RICCK|nr:hypothetical protein A1E_04135 [Rickettsia canadensis str. McKiel]AFB21314.1 hypothetical protein RCA_03775 [Rickettsia canadensis str. CA410]